MNPAIITGNLKSKTSWAAILLMALGGLEQSGLLALVPDDYKGMAISAIGALMLFLRNVTTQAVTDKVVGPGGGSPQGGFVRPLMLALLLAVSVPAALSLQGCESMGLQAPINLTQRIDNAYGNVTAVVNTAIAGRERGQLTAEEGQFISELAKNARVVLQAADTLNKVGDTSGAEGRLLLALGILQQLDNYLNGKQVAP
jgi:hypothetical protein